MIKEYEITDLFVKGKFRIRLLYKENKLCRVILKEQKSEREWIKGKLTEEAKAILEYFRGKRKDFNDLELNLSDFTEKERLVLNNLRHIGFGETKSYKTLAEKCGIPKSARFVGNVCAKNPFPLLIPCHRVIRANGSIGGYSGGRSVKKMLLDFEKGDV